MPTDVVMPQMGESIFEGTITKWLKKPGEKVQRDEPLFEISTDKVDAEIPSPAAGVLKEIKIPEGNTVQVNTVVGVIDAEGAAASQSAPAPAKPAPQAAKPTETKPAETTPKPAPQADGTSTPKQPPATEKAAPVQASGGNGGGASGDGAGVDVVMPQMGESIFEGTLTKWLKKPGDQVQRDEPLFEISTDKVDAEIPAPASGVLRELKVKEGSTVQVNTVVAVIGGAGVAAKPAARPVEVAKTAEAPARPAERPAAPSGPSVPAQREQVIGFPSDRMAEAENVRSSPLVRRIARENQVDLSQVSGTGLGGRISKTDILNFIQQHGATAPARSVQPPRPAPQPQAPTRGAAAPAMPPAPATVIQELRGELVPMSPMRKKIAERMVESKRTSAHVHSIFKVDMTRIVKMRERVRRDWEARNGGKLTFMPFIARALMHGIKVRPVVNASVVGDGVQYHKNINIGIAVALDWGLIVPVVKGAENLSFVGLQRAITDLGERARNKKLVPDDVQGGTITITNPGIFGPQFGTPIILQPQVAILGVGGIFKEPTVVTDADGNDSIAVRHIVRFSLGYDHRIVDGADADQFLAAVKKYLETFDEDIG